jgi:hypothetical protein
MMQPAGPEDPVTVVAVREIVSVGAENAFLAATAGTGGTWDTPGHHRSFGWDWSVGPGDRRPA